MRRIACRRRAASPAVAVPCVLAIAVLLVATSAACRAKPSAPPPVPSPAHPRSQNSDALFLAEAPAFVPEDLEAELDAMGIARLYVAAATLGKDGRIDALSPPPGKPHRPVILAVMGAAGSADALDTGKGQAVGIGWAKGIAPIVAGAKAWADVAGVHLHIDPKPSQAQALADAIGALHAALSVPISVTIAAPAPPETWRPLKGVADHALLLAFGKRPELGDRLVLDVPAETARAFPLPFRLLLVPGGWGRAGDGQTFTGRRISDGQIDQLSEDRSLDFHFGQVLSSEPGALYTFRAKSDAVRRESPLASDGGSARFQVLPVFDLVRFLATAARWSAPDVIGRAFMVDGVPKDGHLVGYPAVKAILTGNSIEPRLSLEPTVETAGRGWTEFYLKATNAAPSPTDLSHENNWIQARVDGGVFSGVKQGDFDRYETLSSVTEGYRPTPLNRATVCRLFENFFAPGESNQTGPLRVAGTHPRVFLSYKLTLPDGRSVTGAEVEVKLLREPAEPVKAPTGPLRRKK